MFKRRPLFAWVCATLIAVMLCSSLSACQGAMGGGEVTVADDLGREVVVPSHPQRIVSLAPSNTEILFALGVGERVVGVTDYCDYPEAVKDKERIGGYGNIDVEKVIKLEPDLVLAEDIHKTEVVPYLEGLGIPVVVIVPHNLEEVMSSVGLIGRLTGTEEKAAEIVSDMEERIDAVKEVTASLTPSQRPRVLYILWWGEGGIMSAGSNTPINEFIELAGGESISAYDKAGDPIIGWPTLSLEEVIEADPEVIIVDLGDGGAMLENILSDSRLEVVSARAQGRIWGIDPDLTTRPTPRMVDGLEAFAQIIHPELFPEYHSPYVKGPSSALAGYAR